MVSRRDLCKTVLTASLGAGALSGVAQPVSAEGETNWSHFSGAPVETSPAVGDSFIYFGDDAGTVTALNKSSQIRRWEFSADGAIKSSPTLVDQVVFVGSRDGRVYAIDTESGDQRWAFETEGAVDSSPTVVDSTVYVGSDDGSLYAVDAATGTQDWVFETDGRIKSSPVVVDETVFFGSWDNAVYAVDTTTGRETWSVRTDGRIETSPTVANDTVYISSTDKSVYALASDSGDKRWSQEISAGGLSTPTVGAVEPHIRDTLYVQDKMGTLHAINAKLGGTRWEYNQQAKEERREKDQIMAPAVVQNLVILGNERGMYGLDGGSGEIDWTAREQTSSAPVVSEGTAYFGSGEDLLAKNVGFFSASGDGSRTWLGTFGHPIEWKYADQTIQTDKEDSSNEEDESPEATSDQDSESTETFDREPEVEDIDSTDGQSQSSTKQDSDSPTTGTPSSEGDPPIGIDPSTLTLAGAGSLIMLTIGWFFGKAST